MSEHSNIAIHRTGSGYVFRILGRGTHAESPAVRDFICGAIEDGADIVLDLSACEYLDSTFLGCLVIMHQRGNRCDGSFKVLAEASVRKSLLAGCRLDRLLHFADESPEYIGDPVLLQVTHLKRKEFGEHLLETHQRLADLGGPAAQTFRCIAEQLRRELDGARPD